MKPIEIEITIGSSDRIWVSIDYRSGVKPVMSRWAAQRSVIDRISSELSKILEDTLQVSVTETEASDMRQGIEERLTSLGLALFHELLGDECDRLRAMSSESTGDRDIIFKVDRQLAHLPLELMHDGHGFLSHGFAIGRLIYSDEPPNVRPGMRAAPYYILLVGDPSDDARIRQDVEEELDAIRSVFTDSRIFSLHIVAGCEADRSFLLGNMPGSTVLHLSGHGVVSHDPERTGIRLGNGHVLSGPSIRGLHDPPAVAFLNVCGAAAGETWQTSLGLIETLLGRGTRACIAALWDLKSKSAALLARRFYKYMIQGETFGHALRKARLDTVAALGLSDPTWAAYTLYGDPQMSLAAAEMVRPKGAKLARALAAICAVLVIIGFLLFPSKTGKDDLGNLRATEVGYLLLGSSPDDARVFVDGREMGLTPFAAEIAVGKHRVTIEKQGYKRWEAWVEVKTSPRTSVEAYLEEIE
jgi:hypothetical protein